MEFKGVKWSLGGISGRMIKTNQYTGYVADVDTKTNALLISKAPDLLELHQSELKTLLDLQQTMYDREMNPVIIQEIEKLIFNKEKLIKEATEI